MENNYIEKIKEYIEQGSIVSMMAMPKKEEDITIGSYFIVPNRFEELDEIIVISHVLNNETIAEMLLIKDALSFAKEVEIEGLSLLLFTYSNFKQTEFGEFNEDVAIILQKK